MFRSVTLDEVRKAHEASVVDIKTDLGAWREKVQTDLKRVRNVYAGGHAAMEELIPRIGETGVQKQLRWAHYRNVPVTRRVIRNLAWLTYGKPPRIEVWVGDKPPGARAEMLARGKGEEIVQDEASMAYSEFVQNTFEQNRKQLLMLRAARQRIRDGRAPIKIWGVNNDGVPVEPFSKLRMDLFKTEDVKFVYDPDDPDQLLAAAEFRGAQGWRLWTADEITWVDPDFTYKADAGAHPIPGMIPLIPFGDGVPMANDLPDYQKVLINSQSTRWAVERATAFPIGVTKGRALNSPDRNPDGTTSVNMGGGITMLMMETDGDFFLVSPDADVAQLRESYKMELEEALSLGGGVPPEAGTSGGGQTPEQPTTIALRWMQSASITRDELILEATQTEDDIQSVLAAYGAEYSSDFELPGFSAEGVDWDVAFPKNPLPHDDRTDKELAMQEVLAGLRLEADYMAEYVYPDATAEELAEIMDALKSSKPAPFDPFNEPPPDFGEEDQL